MVLSWFCFRRVRRNSRIIVLRAIYRVILLVQYTAVRLRGQKDYLTQHMQVDTGQSGNSIYPLQRNFPSAYIPCAIHTLFNRIPLFSYKEPFYVRPRLSGIAISKRFTFCWNKTRHC
ncbi:hypothetical protein RvY_08298 [Ramazzottius varieornatus]|uniref:Uncharacterized protein n=1 Tax=Ramazzottius varieornatus TaxID=947166 RepID=A0A1D1V5G7_RAMVA|nr:hypothetical protein RvY_08298 [Ramazzottius varieornatus]